MTVRAVWNDVVLAESEETVVVEGNHYFPPESVDWQYFTDSATTSACPWKGRANYYTVVVDGQTNTDAAWVYRDPKKAARKVTGRVAFWHGVRVERDGTTNSRGLLSRLRGAVR